MHASPAMRADRKVCIMHHAQKKKTDVYHNGCNGLKATSEVNCKTSSAMVLNVSINTIHTEHQPGPPDGMNQQKSKRFSETHELICK